MHPFKPMMDDMYTNQARTMLDASTQMLQGGNKIQGGLQENKKAQPS